MSKPRVLICSNNGTTIESLKRVLSAWKIDYSLMAGSAELDEVIRESPPDVVIVDEALIDESKARLLSTNTYEGFGATPSLIVLTKSTEEADAVDTFHGVLCDYLKEPFSTSSLMKALKRALEHREFSSTLDTWVSETRSVQNEIREQMKHFSHCLNTILTKDVPPVEANDRKDERVVQTLRPIITSLLLDAKRDPHLKRYEPQLRVLNNCIEELSIDGCTEELVAKSRLDVAHEHSLSKKEIRVLAMIKVGMTTEEIADKMNIASDTVKTHRRNIRKKLELVGNKCNLNSYLQAV